MANKKLLEKAATAILKDGRVDESEAIELRELLYSDKIIDRDECDLLFRLAAETTGNHEKFDNLFIQGVSDHVLKDPSSPGKINKAQAKYLIAKIWADGKVDDLEKALLNNIKKQATEIHPTLAEKIAELGN